MVEISDSNRMSLTDFQAPVDVLQVLMKTRNCGEACKSRELVRVCIDELGFEIEVKVCHLHLGFVVAYFDDFLEDLFKVEAYVFLFETLGS